MKTLILIALLFACTMAVTMKRPMSNAQISKYEQLKKDHKWAGIMMNLAELHLMSQGPLDQLVEAIEDVIDDLDSKIDRAHSDYDQNTIEHQAEVSRINGQIASANEDISHTTEFLNNVLYVQRDNLESDIVNLNESIAANHAYIAEQTQLRELAHQRFTEVVEEHQEALEAVHEALDVLSQLNSDGTSLLQVKKAKKSLDKVQQKISKNVEGSMVKALLALSTGEFANSESIQRVADLLNEVANNLIASVAQYTDAEEEAHRSFQVDIANKEAEINRYSIDLTEKTEQLETTNNSIADNEEFLVQRQNDLVGFEEDLVDENANFDRITELYEDLVSQLEIEASACIEALDVLNNADIAGYIGGRMEQDVIIDQPHGTGITVESDPFDFQ